MAPASKDQTPAPAGLPDAHDGGVAQKQAIADRNTARGYEGVVPDPTPNYNYTVAGNAEPTPETDRGMKAAAAERAAQIERDFEDVVPQQPNPADAPREAKPEPEPEE